MIGPARRLHPHGLPWQALQQRLAAGVGADLTSMLRLVRAAAPGPGLAAGPAVRSWLVRALLDVRPAA